MHYLLFLHHYRISFIFRCIVKRKIILIDSTWPINSRTKKFQNSFSKKFETKVCAWNRSGLKSKYQDDEFVIESNTTYGRRLKKLIHLPVFLFHIIKVLRSVRPDLVFASHWDALILTKIATFFISSSPKIIYDCLDLPTSSNRFLLIFLRVIESVFCRRVNLIILASRYFDRFYSNYNILIYENYPSCKITRNDNSSSNLLEKISVIKNEEVTYLSWIGVVRYEKVLKNIAEVLRLSNGNLNLMVFGDGPAFKWFQDYVLEIGIFNSVHFFGRYEQSDLFDIYSSSDLVWAAYPTEDFNAIYAISNKYFECSYFCKPIIVSANTEMAKNNLSNKNILAVNESDALDIFSTISSRFKKYGTYEKYEPDITWESHEQKLITKIEDLFDY